MASQSVVIVDSGQGNSQYPDSTGGTLYYESQAGSGNTVSLNVNGQTKPIQPGTYPIAASPNGVSLQWQVAQGSIKLAFAPN